MPAGKEQIGDLVRRGVLLFSQAVPFPAAGLVAAASAAAISKILAIHERRVSEILSAEVTLDHISYAEPDSQELTRFYSANTLFPQLAAEFSSEIQKGDLKRLRELYPFLYGALILKKETPSLLFHREIQEQQFRQLAEKYEHISQRYKSIEGNMELEKQINHFGGQLLEVLNEVYDAGKKELKIEKREFAFDVIDYIRDLLTI